MHLNNVVIVIVVLYQVSTELQETGEDIKEEVQDIGFHAHGDMGGDISKCPYFAAKMGEFIATLYLKNMLYANLKCFAVFTQQLPSFSV